MNRTLFVPLSLWASLGCNTPAPLHHPSTNHAVSTASETVDNQLVEVARIHGGAGPYLLEERLVDALLLRAMGGNEDAPGRERYSRSLKAIVQVGSKLDAFVTQPTGAEMEIVPLAHPHGLTAGTGASLTVQVLFKGKPLVGRALMAANRFRRNITTKTLRTDTNGKATFPIGRTGDWMFRLVHIEPSADIDVDWRSYWTSLTFSLPET